MRFYLLILRAAVFCTLAVSASAIVTPSADAVNQSKTPRVYGSTAPITGRDLSKVIYQQLGYRVVKRSFHGVHVFAGNRDSLVGIKDLDSLDNFLKLRKGHAGYGSFISQLEKFKTSIDQSIADGNQTKQNSIAPELAAFFDAPEPAIKGKTLIAVPTDVLKVSRYIASRLSPLYYYAGVEKDKANKLALEVLAKKNVLVEVTSNRLIRLIKQRDLKLQKLPAKRSGRYSCPEIGVIGPKSVLRRGLYCLPLKDFKKIKKSKKFGGDRFDELSEYLGLSLDIDILFNTTHPGSELLFQANGQQKGFLKSSARIRGNHALDPVVIIGAGTSSDIDVLAFRLGGLTGATNETVDKHLIKAVAKYLGYGSNAEFNSRFIASIGG